MDLLKAMSVIIVLFKGEFFLSQNRRSSTCAKRLGCAPFILSVMLSGTKILVQAVGATGSSFRNHLATKIEMALHFLARIVSVGAR
jgi:hypothetical protein